MTTGQTIDWEIANLEGGLYTDGLRASSDSLSLILATPVREGGPPARAPRVGWGPVLAAAVAGGALLGSVVAMAAPWRHAQPRPVLMARHEAAAPRAEHTPIASVSEPAPVETPVEAPVRAPSAIEAPATAVALAKPTEDANASSLRAFRDQVLAASSPASVGTSPHGPAVSGGLEALAARPTSVRPAEAAVVLALAAKRAAACVEPGDRRISMPVSVTFAPSGHATFARVDGGPFVSTATGACIAHTLRGATVRVFEGSPVTVHGSIRIP